LLILADLHQVGANTVIAPDVHDVITLNNVTVSELADLRWDQVDFRTAALHVRRVNRRRAT
jgi:hypothetical protein